MSEQETTKRPPGVCIPWEEQRKQFSQISGDEELVERVWKETDSLGYMYIWQVLLSF